MSSGYIILPEDIVRNIVLLTPGGSFAYKGAYKILSELIETGKPILFPAITIEISPETSIFSSATFAAYSALGDGTASIASHSGSFYSTVLDPDTIFILQEE